MKLKYTILYVDDVAATLEFYGRAFGLAQRFLHPSGDYGELATGSTALAFSSRRLMTDLGKSPGRASTEAPIFELALETTDVAEALDRALKAGAAPIQGVREEPWGQTTAYVADPNGFLVELCSPVRGAPAAPEEAPEA